MELIIQMGHGMQQLSADLINSWGAGTIILSPVNILPNRINLFARNIKKIGGTILFDPQLFYPKNGHEKLKKYPYWPSMINTMWNDQQIISIMRKIVKINNDLGTDKFILPSIEITQNKYIEACDVINICAEYASKHNDKKILATICIEPDIIKNNELLEQFIEKLRNLQVDGFYILSHSPQNEYIVGEDKTWMLGMLKLITCLKLNKKYVIVGYSNHQGLIYGTSKVDAIASGNYLNTRSFNPAKFKNIDNDFRKRSIWYYLPDTMSEYKISTLDVAKQRNLLEKFEPHGDFVNPYSAILFKGAMPSSTNYNETSSFKHYLHCLRQQCKIITGLTYDECYKTYEFMLDSAEQQLINFRKKGMRSYNRDFSPALETNRIAMIAVKEDYELKLKFEWDNM